MIGIDVVKTERIKKAVQNNSGFLRIFTSSEIEYINSKKDKIQTIAGLFAAKEAIAKALGRGFKGLKPNHIEILHTKDGQPYSKVGQSLVNISIAHDGDYAIAVAILENNKELIKEVPLQILNKKQEIITIDKIDAAIPKRNRFSHKGNYANIRIIGGSKHMPGAPFLSACSAAYAQNFLDKSSVDSSSSQTVKINQNALYLHAAAITSLRSGAGLVRLCVPSSLMFAYQARAQEEMLFSMPDKEGLIIFDKDTLDKIINEADSIVIGMGMGDNPELPKIIEYLCNNFLGTLIIDADGLNAISKDKRVIINHKCSLILTPHIGEFLRLNNQEKESDEELAFSALDFALKYDCVVVLKSAYSYITDGVKIYKNITGSAAMAKGGSGDVLAGIIAAFSSYMTPIKACISACYYFGKRGEEAEKMFGSESVLASDLFLA